MEFSIDDCIRGILAGIFFGTALSMLATDWLERKSRRIDAYFRKSAITPVKFTCKKPKIYPINTSLYTYNKDYCKNYHKKFEYPKL